MGTAYRPTFTKPMPAGAEIVTREGQRIARWKDAKGKTRETAVTTGTSGEPRVLIESRTFIAKYRDGRGVIRKVPTGCKDEQAARSDPRRALQRLREPSRRGRLLPDAP